MVLHGGRCSLSLPEGGAGPVGGGDTEAHEGYRESSCLILSGRLVWYWKTDITDYH
jgi:hypothetical protein